MRVLIEDILKNDSFSEAIVIAGKNGLNREVKRISVYDIAGDQSKIDSGIYKEGDFFITCFEQFRDDISTVKIYFDILIKTKSAGLLLVMDDMLHIMTDEIVEYCNQNEFPVIMIPKEITYAEIIDIVNRYISNDNLNAINMLKYEKLLYDNISITEKLDVLYSINPNIKKYIRSVTIEGSFTSEIARFDIFSNNFNSGNDIFIDGYHQVIAILSEDGEKELRIHTNYVVSKITSCMTNTIIGYGRICNKREVSKAIKESKKALETAKNLKISKQEYDPMSSLQLLLTVRDHQEAQEFYDAFVDRVTSMLSENSFEEYMKTIELFVANSGNYKKTSIELNQHEATIRYRINRVKFALDMENDNVKFYETIGIIVKLKCILN